MEEQETKEKKNNIDETVPLIEAEEKGLVMPDPTPASWIGRRKRGMGNAILYLDYGAKRRRKRSAKERYRRPVGLYARSAYQRNRWNAKFGVGY